MCNLEGSFIKEDFKPIKKEPVNFLISVWHTIYQKHLKNLVLM